MKAEWSRYKYLKHLTTDKGERVEERLSRKRSYNDFTQSPFPSQPDSARSLASPVSFASTASLASPSTHHHKRSASHSSVFSSSPFTPQSTSPTSAASNGPPSPPSASYRTTAPSTPVSSLAPSSPPSPQLVSPLPSLPSLGAYHQTAVPVAAIGPFSPPPFLSSAPLLSSSVSGLSHPLAALRLSSLPTPTSSSVGFGGPAFSPSAGVHPQAATALAHPQLLPASAFFPFHPHNPHQRPLLTPMNLAWC